MIIINDSKSQKRRLFMQKKSEKWIENYIKSLPEISDLSKNIENIERKNRKLQKELAACIEKKSKLEKYKEDDDTKGKLEYLDNELSIQSLQFELNTNTLLAKMLKDDLQKMITAYKLKLMTPEMKEMTEKIVDGTEPEQQK